MIRRLTDIARGLTALTAVLALLLAVPFGLWAFGGVPGAGAIDAVGDPLASDETRNEQLLAGLLLIIAWACWAQLAYALILETIAAARGRAARRAPVLPGIQVFAASLITTASLVLTPLSSSVTASTGPLVPMDRADATPARVAHQVELVADMSSRPERVAGPATARYSVGDRDTFWSIAEKTLGDGLRWAEIRELNLGLTMNDGTVITRAIESTRPGWQLELPADAVMPEALGNGSESGDIGVNDAARSAQVTVEQGDHFWSLAHQALETEWGRTPTDNEVVPFWAEMVKINEPRLLPPGDPNLIYPKQLFDVPPVPGDPLAVTDATDVAEPADETRVAVETQPTPTTHPDQALVPREPAPTDPRATASTTPTTPARREAPPAQEQTHEAGFSVASPAALGIGALAVAAGSIAVTLRRRRAQQAAKRPPDTTIKPLPPEAAAYEDRIRPIADTDAARWVEATNRLITHGLGQDRRDPLPAVIAIRAGRHGAEVLLDEPCLPVDGFVPANEYNTAWKVDPDLDLHQIETKAKDTQPFSPALICIGDTEAGDLFVDIEQLATISVSGEPETVDGWFRSIAIGVAANPWSQYCETVALGLADNFSTIDRVVVPADPDDWCEKTERSMRKLHERLNASPYQQRVNPGEIHHPTIVLAGPSYAAEARRLAEVAALVYTPLAVVAAAPIADAALIHLHHEIATLEREGVEFIPAITESAETAVIGELLNNAASIRVLSASEPEAVETDEPETPHPDEHETVDELIARVLEPKPIEVRLLTAMPSVEGIEPRPTTKQVAVIAYLSYHRRVASSRVRDTFWPTATNRSTGDNAISQIRRLLGTDAEGDNRLTQAINTHEYEVSDEIGCDWTRAKDLIEHARNRGGAGETVLLRSALELVDGQVGADAPARQFSWLIDDHNVYGGIEISLVDAANRLGELALGNDDTSLAGWAAAQGLVVVPGNEAMYRLQMRAAAAAGEPTGVRAAYQLAQRSATNLDPWAGIDEETDALFQALGGR